MKKTSLVTDAQGHLSFQAVCARGLELVGVKKSAQTQKPTLPHSFY